MFGEYFDKENHYPSYNVRDLDTNDVNVHLDILDALKKPFDLLVCHFLGIDHAGHSFYVTHPELERKITETEDKIASVIENMDNNTILMLYGDHGMTSDSNHGGGSANEIRAAFFAYSKSGFPMLQNSKFKSHLEGHESIL